MNKQHKKTIGIIALVISAFFAEKFILNTDKVNDKAFNTEYISSTSIIDSWKPGSMVSFEAKVIKLLRDDLQGD